MSGVINCPQLGCVRVLLVLSPPLLAFLFPRSVSQVDGTLTFYDRGSLTLPKASSVPFVLGMPARCVCFSPRCVLLHCTAAGCSFTPGLETRSEQRQRWRDSIADRGRLGNNPPHEEMLRGGGLMVCLKHHNLHFITRGICKCHS